MALHLSRRLYGLGIFQVTPSLSRCLTDSVKPFYLWNEWTTSCFSSESEGSAKLEIPSVNKRRDSSPDVFHDEPRRQRSFRDSRTFDDLSDHSIAAHLHACKMQGRADPMVIEMLVDSAKMCLSRQGFQPVEAAKAIHSLAGLDRNSSFSSSLKTNIQDLALQLTEDLCKNLPGVHNRVLASVTYGLGNLFKGEEDVLATHPRLKACIVSLSAGICEEQNLVAFTQQGLANIIYAYGCLRWRSDLVLEKLGREIINRICGFKSQEIASIILALSKLNYGNEELIVTLGLEAAGGQHAPSFSEQEFCNVVYGLTLLMPAMRSPKILEPILQRLFFEAGSAIRMMKYNRQDIATLVYCIGALNHGQPLRPQPHALMKRLVGKFEDLTDKAGRLDRHLSMVLYACARLDFQDEAFLKKVNEAIELKSGQLDNVWSVTLLLWSLTNLHALTPRVFVCLCDRVCHLRERGVRVTDRSWVQLTQAAHFMDQHPEEVELDPRIKDLLEEALSVTKGSKVDFVVSSN